MYFKKILFLTSFITFLIAGNPNSTLASNAGFCYGPDCSLPPERWGEKFPECSGKKQSPIDIINSKYSKDLPPIEFHYSPTEMVIRNNGHTTEINYEYAFENEDEYKDDNDVDNMGGSSNYIEIGQEKCDLVQFHFHTRSEDVIGSEHLSMEAHLVHQCEAGHLVVVATIMSYLSDTPNETVDQILANSPFDKSSNKYIVDTAHVSGKYINAEGLLPNNRKYYTYKGSLTTPPCSEIVDWYIMQEPTSISKKQVAEFKRILRDTTSNNYPYNNRPLQDANNRVIKRQ
jgi:carbonic anhydrase